MNNRLHSFEIRDLDLRRTFTIVSSRSKGSNNVIVTVGASGFFPGRGFKDLYENRDALYSTFVELSLSY